MRLRISEFLGAVVMLAVAIGAAAIVVLSLASCDAETEQTWPESAEFSQIESGGDRFSMHDTNLTGCKVVVDHETGVEYLVWHGLFEGSVCPLLDADGKPLRVEEAG